MKEKHVLAYDKKYRSKIKMKRLISKNFDEEYRKREAIKQSTDRRNEKQKELKEQVT